MALIKCMNCGSEISDKAPDCIHCAALIEKAEIPNVHFQNDLLILKKEKQNLENENAIYRASAVETKNELMSERAEKEKIVIEKDILDTQKTVNALETKIKRTKKIKTLKKKSEKVSVKIGTVLRLIVVGFFTLGAIVSLLSAKFGLALWYGSIAVTTAPYIYRFIWKKINFDKAVRVAIQIIVPIIATMIITIF